MKYKYEIIIEKAENNYSAFSPDVPGCIAVGDTVEETLQEMEEAIEFHLEGLKERGLPIPEPKTNHFYVEVNA
ncbi:MAG: type II toxin-antitoxin system HicB family antitoxin [Crinalium sp.]